MATPQKPDPEETENPMSDLPEAMMAIFRKTGVPIHDAQTGLDFRELDLLAAVDHVFAGG